MYGASSKTIKINRKYNEQGKITEEIIEIGGNTMPDGIKYDTKVADEMIETMNSMFDSINNGFNKLSGLFGKLFK